MTMQPPNAQFRHIGIYVRELGPMLEFYQRVLGLIETDSGLTNQGGRIVFLSRSPEEHHQIVLVEGRNEAMGSGLLNQISFRVDTLGDLKRFNEIILAVGAPIDRAMNHGNAWSIYCFDPEGNRIELYAGSPWYVAQPCYEPLDLTESEEAIIARTEAFVLAQPSYEPGETWSCRQAQEMGG